MSRIRIYSALAVVCLTCPSTVFGIPRRSKAGFLPAIVQPGPAPPPFLNTNTQQPSEIKITNGCLRTSRGLFPSTSCSKYVNCWDGNAVEQECPQGLLFNAAKSYCDFPQNVNCQLDGYEPQQPPSPSPTGLPQSPPTPTDVSNRQLEKKCLKGRGLFPSDACHRYVNCWDGTATEQQCPEGLLFSPNKGYCDYPQNVNCHDNERSNQATSDKKNCPRESGTFRDVKNCSNYFTCINGKIVAQYTCPENFSFNYNLGVCDYSERVDCSQEPPTFYPIRSDILKKIPKDFLSKMENCDVGSVFRLNPECTIAGICRVGVTEIVECPEGFAYDSRRDKCLLLQLARC